MLRKDRGIGDLAFISPIYLHGEQYTDHILAGRRPQWAPRAGSAASAQPLRLAASASRLIPSDNVAGARRQHNLHRELQIPSHSRWARSQLQGL